MKEIKAYEKLLEEYKECAKIHNDIDYADKSSVKKGNNAVVNMISIAKTINNVYSERIEEFSILLNDDKDKIDIWVAHHILEYMNYTENIQYRAISVIKKYSKENTTDGLGNRMWLKEWQKNKK